MGNSTKGLEAKLKAMRARLNGMLSRGPMTAEGKERAAQNALKHGLRAKTYVVKGERKEEFDELAAGVMAELSPEGPVERFIAAHIVTEMWRLRRAAEMSQDVLRREMTKDAWEWKIKGKRVGDEATRGRAYSDPWVMERFEMLRRYEASLDRALYRWLGEMERRRDCRVESEDCGMQRRVSTDSADFADGGMGKTEGGIQRGVSTDSADFADGGAEKAEDGTAKEAKEEDGRLKTEGGAENGAKEAA